MQDSNPQSLVEETIARALRNMANLNRVHFASITKASFSDGQSSVTTAEGDYVADEGTFMSVIQEGQVFETLSLKYDNYVRDGEAWVKVAIPAEWMSRIAQSATSNDPSEISVPAWGPICVQDYVFTVEHDVPSDEREFDIFFGVPATPDSISAFTNSTLKLWVDKPTAHIVRLQKTYDFGPPINKTSVITTTFSRFNDPHLVLPLP